MSVGDQIGKSSLLSGKTSRHVCSTVSLFILFTGISLRKRIHRLKFSELLLTGVNPSKWKLALNIYINSVLKSISYNCTNRLNYFRNWTFNTCSCFIEKKRLQQTKATLKLHLLCETFNSIQKNFIWYYNYFTHTSV